MILIALIAGIGTLTFGGWILIRLMERNESLWTFPERISISFLIGSTSFAYLLFLGNIYLGIPLSGGGYFGILLVWIGALLLMWRYYCKHRGWNALPIKVRFPKFNEKTQFWQILIMAILGIWTLLKLTAGGYMLFASPPYFYDTLLNWNMRGKIFYYQKAIAPIPYTLTVDLDSYPPTVSLMKSWLSILMGHWSEPLANGIHLFWLIAITILLFSFIRKRRALFPSFLGAYVLLSLPLFMFQGVNAFADVFMSAHIFMVLFILCDAVSAPTQNLRDAYYRLCAIALSLLIFTKNEGMILYGTILGSAMIVSILVLRKSKQMSGESMRSALLWTASSIFVIGMPWLLYKVSSGMTFGNAKPLSGMSFMFQPNVIKTIFVMTFLEGNWHFLFLIFFGLLAIRHSHLSKLPLSLFTGVTLLLYSIQIVLHVFTSLSIEALIQTGYARGVIHIVPLIVGSVILLLFPPPSQGVDSIKQPLMERENR